MLQTIRTPYTATITRSKGGQPITSRMIQTKDAKYVEVKGKWRTLPLDQDDVQDMEESLDKSKLTCARVGEESVGGKTAAVYTIHVKNEDVDSSGKFWLGSDGLPLKSESTQEGVTVSSTYDFAHAEAPPDATPLDK